MKFVCERCHTKYSIADEKVRGKVLKVRCKTCANVITVRETGATIDDSVGAGPKEASVSQSGSIGGGKPSERKPATLPADALLAPGTPAFAPPPRRSTPTPIAPPPPIDAIEWYLAVDGAQTGPFPQSRLCDKILALPRDADVHVWNGDFDAWKPPQTVPELQAELNRRRRTPTPRPPPPLRRSSGPVPLAAVPAERAGGAGAQVTPDTQVTRDPQAVPEPQGFSAAGGAALDPEAQPSKSHAPGPKKNGVPASNGAPTGAPKGALGGFGVGDLIGESGAVVTPAPAVPVGPAIGRGAVPGSVVRQTRFSIPDSAGIDAAAAGRASARPVKLVFGALGVAIVLCGIVGVWIFRRPGPAVTVAVVTPAKPAAPDFASLTEKLAKEEAEPPPTEVKTKPADIPPPVAVVDIRPAPSPPVKGGRRARRKGQAIAPPPLGMAATPTAEEREAASRFGDSTGRDVRLSMQTGAAAHSTTPAQADISRVINNNRQGIQTCYQRALLRDNTLTHGKVTVRVSIGLSGKVKSVSLDAPAQFRALEPCIREVMSRWAFPPSSEEYGTEFPVVLQGNQ